MNDHLIEEQEMEAEALAAIFSDAFEIRSCTQPFIWSIKLLPTDTGGDEDLEEKQNYVGARLVATIPLNYPEEVGPEFDIEILKGLAEEQRHILLELAQATADANMGMPSIFSCCEAVRDWLVDNNIKGQDDGSMYAQMMRKAKEVEKSKILAAQQYESQKKVDEMSKGEKEDYEVRKRREEGTPVNDETFLVWKRQFEAEMAELKAQQRESADKEGCGKKLKLSEKREDAAQLERLTGFEQFSGKAGLLAMAALEKEADEWEERLHDLDVDGELFDEEEDLDDLDFDDDDDDSYDEDDEELDI